MPIIMGISRLDSTPEKGFSLIFFMALIISWVKLKTPSITAITLGKKLPNSERSPAICQAAMATIRKAREDNVVLVSNFDPSFPVAYGRYDRQYN